MSHTGGKEGTYPGTRASATMIGDDETNWGTKSLAILDMPFTAYWTQYYYRGMCSAKTAQCARALKKAKPTRKKPITSFPPPKCLQTES